MMLLLSNSKSDCNLVYNETEFIEKEGQMEFWWDVSITAPVKVKHNKPDFLIWCRDTRTCKIVDRKDTTYKEPS